MNILFIANCASAYGANLSMIDLIIPLKKMGHKVYVMLPYEGQFIDVLAKNQVPYIIKPFKNCAHHENEFSMKEKGQMLFRNLSLLSEIGKHLKEWKIDVIHTNASNVDIGVLLSKKYRIPHVWHLRELLKDDYQLFYDFPQLDNYLLRKTERIICISEFLRKGRNLEGNNLCVIADGLDTAKYLIDKKDVLKNDKRLELLFAGYMTESKGVMDAVRAVDILVNRYKMNVHLTLAGDSSPLLEKIKENIKYRGLEENIEHVGYQNDMKSLREKADIALMCSRSEALGRVTIESMLGEVLVIGAAAGATQDLIRDGVTGYLYEPGNVIQLSQIIQKVFEEKENSRRVIKRAKQYAINRFDADRYADRIVKLYKNII